MRTPDFWDEQDRVPLLERDSMWWASVGFTRLVVTLAVVAVLVGISMQLLT